MAVSSVSRALSAVAELLVQGRPEM